jgi:putative endonuclease
VQPPSAALRSLIRRAALWRAVSLRRPFRRTLLNEPLNHLEIGDLGEQLAVLWLSRHGRKVLYRNFAAPSGGEVDIVCRHHHTLTFVEVKTRTRVDHRRPADAVTQDKQHLIQRGARAWLRLLPKPVAAFRFDIAEVILTEGELPHVNVIENAFQLPAGERLGQG